MRKKRILSAVLAAVGTVALMVGWLVPVAAVKYAEQNGTLGIIGGADGPTYIYVRSTMAGGIMPAVMALGALALISGVIVWIVDAVQRKRG